MRKLLDLIFPPLCLSCEKKTGNGSHLFCKGCCGFFELIDHSSRCLYCFRENGSRRACSVCCEKKHWHLKAASALDYLGAVSALVKALKAGSSPYLAKTAAAFMTAQFVRLQWPIPDMIIPVPSRHGFFGRNHAALLAAHLAKNLRTKYGTPIKRKLGDFSQARLSQAQREKLSPANFYLRRKVLLEDKILLLIDDVMTTGTTLRNCAEILSESFPARIYALTLARTI